MALQLMQLKNMPGIDAAKRAIKNFKTKGLDFTFDPNSNAQCTEYLQLRQCNERVTAETLMWSLQNKATSVDSSVSIRFTYYGVPKANFPDGLPKSLKASELGEEDLNDLECLSGAGIDTETYYIIDCEVERSKLGQCDDT